MSNLHEIKRRIASATSTKQITRTMEMVSTAKIRRALDRAQEAAPYKDAITLMLANVSEAGAGGEEPLLRKPASVRCALLIVIASDRGLAGGFNMSLQRAAEQMKKDLEATGVKVLLVTCGRKPTEYFRYRGVTPTLSFAGISSEPTMEEADQIASYLIDGFSKETIDRCVIFYQHARNRVEQDEVIEQLLPVDSSALKLPTGPRTHEAVEAVGTAPAGGSQFEFDPSASKVLGYLMPAYVRTVIYHALLDSAAAEHGARRRAMQSATENATEVITTLNRTYNRLRQSSITTELNEIVGGASALEDM
ncbi:MAG: ATP synthase F1 subunit gamma [Atopobiaceae bacterium]|jgi:F-type H+-transporting ATPase subunit gamma|nr:ATP synthase F1 subunit gamma [Atopobiaceae bacterium]